MENVQNTKVTVSVGLFSQKQVHIIIEIQAKMHGLTYIEAKEIFSKLDRKIGYTAVIDLPLVDAQNPQ